jgi:hypothetical protein
MGLFVAQSSTAEQASYGASCQAVCVVHLLWGQLMVSSSSCRCKTCCQADCMVLACSLLPSVENTGPCDGRVLDQQMAVLVRVSGCGTLCCSESHMPSGRQE